MELPRHEMYSHEMRVARVLDGRSGRQRFAVVSEFGARHCNLTAHAVKAEPVHAETALENAVELCGNIAVVRRGAGAPIAIFNTRASCRKVGVCRGHDEHLALTLVNLRRNLVHRQGAASNRGRRHSVDRAQRARPAFRCTGRPQRNGTCH